MNAIKEIILAWAAAANPTDAQMELAEYRLGICTDCPSKKSKSVNDIKLEYCGECGCPLKGKVFTPMIPGCPLKKW